MLLAYRCALASPRVTAAGVEATEFAIESDRMGVVSVPAVAVNGRIAWVGNVPERSFVQQLLQAASG